MYTRLYYYTLAALRCMQHVVDYYTHHDVTVGCSNLAYT